MMRVGGRKIGELRDINITRDYITNAEGSCLLELGDTRVICTASIEKRVPLFLRDSGKGWVTAEYAMLPRATDTRTPRDRAVGRISGRSQEIQRLIGRSLRSVVDLEKLGERTIWIDCDVIQADGSTRTAAISGAFIALHDALSYWADENKVDTLPITEFLAAVSVGIVEDSLRLDLDFSEDSIAQVDMNLVMTESKKVIEIQGTAETSPFSREDMEKLVDLAGRGISQIIDLQKEALGLHND